jgi:hypothetical protein
MPSKPVNVQKLDISLIKRMTGAISKVRQVHEVWHLRGWRFKAIREHTETTFEIDELRDAGK